MGWEQRRRGGRYYTRSRRVNGRVVREYVGSGLAAELVAEQDRRQRADRLAAAAAWRGERSRLDEVEAALIDMCDAADRAVRAAFTEAGYYQHARGEWRRKRGSGTSGEDTWAEVDTSEDAR